MKFNVEKFNKETNGSHFFCMWEPSLLEMIDEIGVLPDYINGKHTFSKRINKRYIRVGFDDEGNLFLKTSAFSKKHDDNVPKISINTANLINEFIISVLGTFFDYGYIIQETKAENTD